MNNNLSSKIISLIRFPMICGIVLIHSQNNNFVPNDVHLPLYTFLSNILSNGIARICVPLFYFISGYLFFYQIKKWNTEIYLRKLKRRIQSLLYPYFIYISLAILCFWILQQLMPQFLSGANKPIAEWNLTDLLRAYWKYGDQENTPFVGPLWFIRNLMVIVIFSPAIYLFITKFKTYGIILLGIFWIMGYKEFAIPGTMALFFFCAGSYYSIFKLDFAMIFTKIKISYIYLFLLFLDTFTKDKVYNEYLHRITIILGILFFIKIIVRLISKYDVKLPPILLASSFFIYAVHEPYYDQIRKIIFKILPLANNTFYMDIQMSVYYLSIAILYICFLILIFSIISRHIPLITKILSVGR